MKLFYPEAEWRGDGVSGGTFTSGPFKLVLHTTETRGLPPYRDGRSAPHLTYNPKNRKWYQHTRLNTAARALRNTSEPGQTNRDSAIQVEIICYSNGDVARDVDGLYVGDLPHTALEDLAAFARWLMLHFGVQPVWPQRKARSYGEANAPGFRMTAAEYDVYGGMLGHQHVPENSHWDPGNFDWVTFMLLVQSDGMFTEHEVKVLKDIVAAIDAAGSSGDAIAYLIKMIRVLRAVDDVFDANEF